MLDTTISITTACMTEMMMEGTPVVICIILPPARRMPKSSAPTMMPIGEFCADQCDGDAVKPIARRYFGRQSPLYTHISFAPARPARPPASSIMISILRLVFTPE